MRSRRRLAAALTLLAAAMLVTACGHRLDSPTPAASHAVHAPQTQRVMAALESELGMAFQPAGPHHELGTAPDGVEMDLVGVPVEQVVPSLPAQDPEAGLAYLPHVRDLLHGPDRVYDWAAAMLACRADEAAACEERVEQGNLEARFSDGGPDYVVVTFSRGP